MKIRMLSACSAAGQHLAQDSVHELPEAQAKELVAMGRAVAFVSHVSQRDPVVETRDPEPVVDAPKKRRSRYA